MTQEIDRNEFACVLKKSRQQWLKNCQSGIAQHYANYVCHTLQPLPKRETDIHQKSLDSQGEIFS
jgi:hypothetical protein